MSTKTSNQHRLLQIFPAKNHGTSAENLNAIIYRITRSCPFKPPTEREKTSLTSTTITVKFLNHSIKREVHGSLMSAT